MKLGVDQLTNIYMDLASDETQRMNMLGRGGLSGVVSPAQSAMQTIAATQERWSFVSAVTVTGLQQGCLSVGQALHPTAGDWVCVIQAAEANPGMYGHLSGVYQQMAGSSLTPGMIEEMKKRLSGIGEDTIVMAGVCEGACSMVYPDGGAPWEDCVKRCRGPR